MNSRFDSLFDPKIFQSTREFYNRFKRWQEVCDYRRLTQETGHIKNLFYGDSITDVWPLHEFFPRNVILNRGIGGDNIHGLYMRLEQDVFPYTPEKVFILIGINGIEQEKKAILERTRAVVELIRERGSQVYLGSILPLRNPDNWNRFQYQEKIVEINLAQQEWCCNSGNCSGFLNFHALLRDDAGELGADYAQPDGTHLTFAAYRKMADLVRPLLA